MQARAIQQITDTGSAAELLGYARTRKADAEAAEADLLAAAAAWAEMHPPESIHDAATWPGTSSFGEGGLTLAGEGAPLVAEFCVAELAAALKMSTDAGRTLIAHGLELKYRLTRTHTRVTAGALAPWRARKIAEHTLGLSWEAAAFVDTQVAPFAHRVSWAQLERLIAEAKARFMPAAALSDAQAAAERRHLSIHDRQVSFDGTVEITGELDLADALDLDDALARGAASLAAGGCAESLDVRRSMAAGEIARRQLALDLASGQAPVVEERAPASVSKPQPTKPRQVVLYVHLSEAAITGTTTPEGIDLARVENRHQGVTADQVKGWCANPDTHVVVKPVIDLTEHISVNSYEVPDRLAEQAALRDGTCVFPWCTRPARSCDCDHVIPHSRGGPTCSCNTAPLCRRHHRLKTHHSGWSYTVLEPGSYLWSSPHGYQFLRDHEGTDDVTRVRLRPPDQ